MVAYIGISLLFKAKQYFLLSVHHIAFICLLAGGHWGCVHCLATVSNAAVNMGAHMSLRDLLSGLGVHPHVQSLDPVVILPLIS